MVLSHGIKVKKLVTHSASATIAIVGSEHIALAIQVTGFVQYAIIIMQWKNSPLNLLPEVMIAIIVPVYLA